jgi:uncharacterized protein YbjT (DUF2867 family)
VPAAETKLPTGPVFVAGATGYTGREVVRQCAERGLETYAHVRPDSANVDRWRREFEAAGAPVDQTAWELGAMKARLEALQPRWVFALLGTTAKRGKRGSGSAVADTYEAVDYGLSILLLEAAVACGSRPRFVYLSALGAEGRPINAYMDVRKRVEAALRGSGLPYVIARPAFVTGSDREESRPAERIAARVADGVLGLARKLGASGIAEKYGSITGKQLAHAMIVLADEADAGARMQVVAEAGELRLSGGVATPPR